MLSLEKVLNETVVANAKANKRDGKVSLSGIGHCLRQLLMTERKYDETYKDKIIPMKDQQYRVFCAGNTYEKVVYDLIKSVCVGYQIPTEYRGIKGTADIIVKDGDQNILVDIKTVNSLKFGYLDKGEIDEGYALQITAYWLGLQKEYKLSNICRIFYVEKDNFLTREVAFDVKDWIAKVDDRITKIEEARKIDDLPDELIADPVTGKQPWHCFSAGKMNGVRVWCQYLPLCNFAYNKYEQALKVASEPKVKKIKK